MKNIVKVILLTDSNNNSIDCYQVFFDDESNEKTSQEMNVDLFYQVQKWLKTNNVEYNIDNFSLKTKQQIKNKIEYLYSKALILQIENGFTFQIDLKSKYGTELLNIVENSIGSYSDEFKSKKITTFFINVNENNTQKQIYCACYNWIWQYIFEELLLYVKTIKQLKENFIVIVENSSIEQLKEIEFNFIKENGIKINVSKTIQKLLEITSDVDFKGNVIVIPEFVKEAIRKTNRELFKYSEQEELKDNINTIISKSWFE